MKALQFMSPNVMAVNNIDIPRIAEDEVLLASRAVGICHSDIEHLRPNCVCDETCSKIPMQFYTSGKHQF